MQELEAAVEQILSAIPSPKVECIPLSQAHGRILAELVHALNDLPLFDNSAMDGYAVRVVDVKSACADAPVRLRLIGRVAAGDKQGVAVASGTSVRLFTGSPLPKGADAVVMQEDTQVDPANPNEITFLSGATPWENVRMQGEDVHAGVVLADAGEILTAGRIALFAATGTKEVLVGKRPVVGLLATGSELVEAGEKLEPGRIYESNRLMLAALIEKAGAEVHIYPLVKDTLAETQDSLRTAFAECDVVVTSGGVSVGEMDFVKSAFERLGGSLEFWKVAIKPGRPFVFGKLGGKFLFGLPGNPVSALVTFLLLVRPALMRWQGAKEVFLPVSTGTLAEPLSNPGDRRHFMRVFSDRDGRVKVAGTQASHILSSLAQASSMIDVPPRTVLPAGAIVNVMRWE
jgi:molybdopterin molybdotransferase